MTYGWGNNGFGAGWWIVMVLMMLVFWTAVAFGIVALVRRSGSTRSRDDVTPETPESLLRARFARGEVDEAEFRTRMAALKEHP
jgi:putative membrane protein